MIIEDTFYSVVEAGWAKTLRIGMKLIKDMLSEFVDLLHRSAHLQAS